jgi:hypothetical protein
MEMYGSKIAALFGFAVLSLVAIVYAQRSLADDECPLGCTMGVTNLVVSASVYEYWTHDQFIGVSGNNVKSLVSCSPVPGYCYADDVRSCVRVRYVDATETTCDDEYVGCTPICIGSGSGGDQQVTNPINHTILCTYPT